MKTFTLLSLFAILAPACTVGAPEEGESTQGLTGADSAACNTYNGLQPTKASLAVAMANELQRWEPLVDLVTVYVSGTGDMLQLSAAGIKRCSEVGSSCANTKALLNLQYTDVNQVIDQNLFNATAYRGGLTSGLTRQRDHTNNLKMNNPGAIPAPHKLTKVGGPTNLGIGACGPHWLFKPTNLNGSTYTKPANLANNLYVFSHPFNEFIAFTVTNGNVAVDPIDGDNSTPTTTSGSCPTYELDRVYNPTNTLLSKCCVTVGAKNGALVALPRAAGYLGCKAGAVPTR